MLTRRHFNDRFEGTLTNSVTGASVSYDARSTYLHDLAVPGDSSTGIERDTMPTRVDTGSGAVVLTRLRPASDEAGLGWLVDVKGLEPMASRV